MIGYFSRLSLTKAGVEKRSRASATGKYQLHRELWGLFPDTPDAGRSFLFCDMGDGRTVFLLSEKRPVENESWVVETKEYNPCFENGDLFCFRLCANPTKANSKTGRHQRHDVVMDMKKSLRDSGYEVDMNHIVHESIAQWIRRKGMLNGFETDTGSLIIHSYDRSEFNNGEKNIVISTAVIEGVLRVTDKEKFLEVLKKGIGSAKGFGCGLLMIKRP